MPGGIVHLKRGGHQIRAETIMLNDGIDHVIYLLAPGLAFGSWRPDGGHQLIRNFDLGVDKLWFVAASPADTRNSAALKRTGLMAQSPMRHLIVMPIKTR